MYEVQLYKAQAQARHDMAEGIDTDTAIRTAARRYGVPMEAVQAYAIPAHRACCRAADTVEQERRN